MRDRKSSMIDLKPVNPPNPARTGLTNSHAYEVFLRRDFNAALKALEKTDPSISDRDFEHVKSTIDTLKSISRKQLYSIKGNPAKMKLLIALEAEVKNLLAELEAMRTLDTGAASQ